MTAPLGTEAIRAFRCGLELAVLMQAGLPPGDQLKTAVHGIFAKHCAEHMLAPAAGWLVEFERQQLDYERAWASKLRVLKQYQSSSSAASADPEFSPIDKFARQISSPRPISACLRSAIAATAHWNAS